MCLCACLCEERAVAADDDIAYVAVVGIDPSDPFTRAGGLPLNAVPCFPSQRTGTWPVYDGTVQRVQPGDEKCIRLGRDIGAVSSIDAGQLFGQHRGPANENAADVSRGNDAAADDGWRQRSSGRPNACARALDAGRSG